MNKEERKEVAKRWTRKMETEYADEIRRSIHSSKVYCHDTVSHYKAVWGWDFYYVPTELNKQDIVILDASTVEAIATYRTKYPDKRIAALNFASYKYPGGGYMTGMYAQEESICSASTLYNVLSHFTGTFYDKNRVKLNRGLYNSDILYSPEIYFPSISGCDKCYCDIITCAAPNWGAARRNQVTRSELIEAMTDRIMSILTISQLHGVDILILGAFGCGVFKNDPYDVACIFSDIIYTSFNCLFEQIIFAIPDASSKNYCAFKNQFIKED